MLLRKKGLDDGRGEGTGGEVRSPLGWKVGGLDFCVERREVPGKFFL